MNKHLVLGKINRLQVVRVIEFGVVLASLDEKEVLLPNAYVTKDMEVGYEVDVFLYTDSEDRLVATTLKPKAMLDELGVFKVVDSAKFGVFVDWGLPKDLLIPTKLQKHPLKVGDTVLAKVVYDEKTHRLVATTKLSQDISNDIFKLKIDQKVNITPYQKTDLGYKVLVDGRFLGLIYHNEIFSPIELAVTLDGYIKKVRNDRLLDIKLQKDKKEQKNDASSKIIALLKQNRGSLAYNYKTSPELIYEVFGLSKKLYKATLTKLSDDKIITIKDSGIYLGEKDEKV
ncbi:MAG: S1-like domain-containing RNA-binding protein [Sulfurimonas sp.]|jgi:predicted RNA-binding protein (virulence factor B family)|nr:S1-like domain-containing RNA-binding protein [Sulfurimonadaceae bacterium]